MRLFFRVVLLNLLIANLNYSIGFAQNSIVIQPGSIEGKDAIVHTIFPGTNLGNSNNIIAAAWTYQSEFGIIRALFQFDFSDVPDNLPIDSAFLSLYNNPTCGHEGHAGANASTIAKIIDSWQENIVTWNNQPETSDVNQVIIGPSISNNDDFIDIPITALVEEMISNPEANNGFLLKLITEETYRSLTFASSDYIDSLLWPKIEIFYSCFVDLGNDTTLCEGDSLVLSTEPEFTSYLWNNQSTDSTLTITTSGTYWVEVWDDFDCFTSDTIYIEFVPNPDSILNLGSDTTLCYQDTLLLSIYGNFSSYQWQDGSSDSVFSVTQTGNYFVTVTNDCGMATDSINVIFSEEINLDLGNDTIICSSDTFMLSAGTNYSEYLWSNGSTSSTLSITSSGQYWVQVTNKFGCSATDSIEVIFGPDLLTNFSLGPDTTLCYGESLLLTTGSGFDTCYWQNGSTGPDFYVAQAGEYIVTVGNQCGETSDTINVNFFADLGMNLGNDTTLCTGEIIYITPDNNYQHYLWQDGSIASNLLVYTSGLYSVEVTDYNNCNDEDEITISYLNVDIELGPDTSICENSEFALSTNFDYPGILWNDSIENEEFWVDQPGTYWVKVFDSIGQKYCFDFDTIFIQFKETPSLENFLLDYNFCQNDSITISAPAGDTFTYLWSTGSSDNNITLKNPGSYYLTVQNECDTIFKSFNVSTFPEAKPEIIPDTISEGEIIRLSLSTFFESYLWSDGSILSSIEVNQNGIYYVNVKNEYNCFGMDSITINPFDCITYIPAVFTPNYDYSNDLFFIDASNVSSFQIQILNRWGEMVYKSEDKNFKWDGTYNGNQCADGTYYWIINYNCSKFSGNQSQRILKGNLTLLR